MQVEARTIGGDSLTATREEQVNNLAGTRLDATIDVSLGREMSVKTPRNTAAYRHGAIAALSPRCFSLAPLEAGTRRSRPLDPSD